MAKVSNWQKAGSWRGVGHKKVDVGTMSSSKHGGTFTIRMSNDKEASRLTVNQGEARVILHGLRTFLEIPRT